jgi:hypothetical protein
MSGQIQGFYDLLCSLYFDDAQIHLARQSHNKRSECLAQRRKGRKEKKMICHFDRGEKSFSDRSHALGMTVQHHHLAFVAFWREQTSFAGDIDLGPGCSALVLRLIVMFFQIC